MKKYNFKTRLLCLLLSVFMLIPLTTQVYAVDSISNTDGHWAEETMLYWNSLGLFQDVPEDEFGIDKAISRGAFVHIFNKMINVPTPESSENNFNDISESDWNYNDIVTANNIGYINGYPNKTFRAASPITREEMCTIVSRYYNLAKVYDNTKLQDFTDKDTIQDYATDAVGALAELEIVKGYPSGAFKPKNNITWAEAVTIITRFLGYINGGSGVSGRVYYEDKPVYNAEITVYDNDKLTVAAEATSDLYGDYIIDVSAGTYDITVSKDGKISMLADVIVSGDVRTYSKVELLPGQYVTGKLVNSQNKGVADTELTFTGVSSLSATTDENGKFELTLPENDSYSIYAEVNGKTTELASFKTGSTDEGLDLGEIILSTEKTTVKSSKTELPLWYIDSIIRKQIETSDDDKDDDATDYSKLPYRKPKTMAELVELNGGVQPEIVVDDNGTVISYRGKFSNNKITNHKEAITELNNLAEILNIKDSRYEFELRYDFEDGRYSLQQVYKSIPVEGCFVTVYTSDSEGIVVSSDYNPNVNNKNIDTNQILDQKDIEKLISEHFDNVYNGIAFEITDMYLTINNEYIPVYVISVGIENNTPKMIKINAYTGIIIFESSIEPVTSNYSPAKISLALNPSVTTEGAKKDDIFYLHNIDSSVSILTNQYCGKSAEDIINELITSNDKLEIIHSETNTLPYTGHHKHAITLLNNFNNIIETVKSATKWKQSDFSHNVVLDFYKEYNNACYNGKYDKLNPLNDTTKFVFGYHDGKPYATELDVVGHEFTHFIQDYFIGNRIGDLGDGSLGGAWSNDKKTSKNISWVETEAISEGTADVLGMLLEAKIEGIPLLKSTSSVNNEALIMGDDTLEINHTGTSEDGINTLGELYDTYVHDNLVCYQFEAIADFSIGDRNFKQGTEYHLRGCYSTHHDELKYLSNLSKDEKDKIIRNYGFIRGDEMTYDTGVGHDERYIVGTIYRHMLESRDPYLCDINRQIQLWVSTLQTINNDVSFRKLRERVIDIACSKLWPDETVEEIEKAFDAAGIISTNAMNKAEKWQVESIQAIAERGLLSHFVSPDETYDPKSTLTQEEYIQLMVDFCNEAGANLNVTYHETKDGQLKAVLKIPSSQSMSLIFDESKDILRWEAFIITDRIFNFCHDVTAEYNFPYLDNTTEAKAETYAIFIKLLANSETEVKNGLPKVDAAEVLNMYYGGLTYDQFYESYMYVKNSANSKDNTKYNFSGDGYQFTESQRVVLDSMYNIYMSLGKNLAPVTKKSSGETFNVCEPMTLASACYLLYAYMK